MEFTIKLEEFSTTEAVKCLATYTSNAKLLDQLVENGKSVAFEEVARNPNTSSKTLDKLAAGLISDVVAEIVAENPKTSSTALAQLAKNKNWHVRRKVALNSNTLLRTLEKLAKDDDDYLVRWSVSKNPKTSSKILQILLNDDDSDVRKAVARKILEKSNNAK